MVMPMEKGLSIFGSFTIIFLCSYLQRLVCEYMEYMGYLMPARRNSARSALEHKIIAESAPYFVTKRPPPRILYVECQARHHCAARKESFFFFFFFFFSSLRTRAQASLIANRLRGRNFQPLSVECVHQPVLQFCIQSQRVWSAKVTRQGRGTKSGTYCRRRSGWRCGSKCYGRCPETRGHRSSRCPPGPACPAA